VRTATKCSLPAFDESITIRLTTVVKEAADRESQSFRAGANAEILAANLTDHAAAAILAFFGGEAKKVPPF
jgi:hypothetical protein